MPATISKADVRHVMQDMSDEGMNLDEFVERIILLSKVRSGLEQSGEGIPHEEVVDEFKKPRSERKWN